MSDPQERVVHLEKQSLKRVLGAWDLFAVGYGDVGSSIYYALGLVAMYALGATPIALAIAGFVFICTALTYAEMSSTFPEPGGSATFSRYAFNDLISFIAGWGLLLDYILTIAISAFAIPPYLRYLFPHDTSPTNHIASTVGIIFFLYLINVVGVKHSGRFSLILALVTILSQALIILIAALFVLNLPYVFSHMKINAGSADWSPNWWEFLKGTAMAMVAYTGIESIAQLAAESTKPSVTIPRSIKWTMATLVVLYFGVSVVGLSVISPQELGSKYADDPIAGIVAQLPFGGQWLAPWFGLIAALILLIASNAGLIGCSRLTFSMGEYYQVPHFLYKMHRRFRTPYISLAVFSALAAAIVMMSGGRMLFLADLYNFGAQIAFFSAHMSLLVLRIRKPTLQRPFKAPFNIPLGKGRSIPLTAIVGALATFAVWLTVIITKPDGRNLGFIWLSLGILMYCFYRKRKQIAVLGRLSIEKIKIPAYHPMHLSNVLVTARLEGNADALQTACQLAKSFHAKITAVHIMEISPSLPMHISMTKREEQGEAALKRAEAVAREYGLSIELKLVRARTIEGAILDLVTHGHYDMVVIGARKTELHQKNHFVHEAERLLKDAPCRILFCKS
jgi:APA family basic amino acid/polyamine antiporter